jgi:hypothetical protein
MKQLLLVAVLLLGGAWVAAQSTPSSDPSSSVSGSSQSSASQSGSATSSQSGSEASGSHQSVEGCLSGSDGKYTLTDKQGTTYQLTGDTSKLAEHVGHEVKITGSSGAGAGSAGSAASSGAGAGGGQTLEVKSVKHVSKSCQSGGMAK